MRVSPAIVAAAFAVWASHADAQTLLETSGTLGLKPDPVNFEFQVAAAGSYRIVLTDFGTVAGPQRMSRVDAAVTHGSDLVHAVSVASANPTGIATATFAAAAGTHRLVLIGQPAAGATVGSAGVRVDDPGSGAVLFETLQTFTRPPPPVASPADFELELAVPAGNYTLTTTDLALPGALAVVHTTVIRRSDGSVLVNMAPPATPVALAAGTAETFEVFVHAELAAGIARGLAGVSLRDAATSTVVRHELFELGEWRYRFDFDVSSAATLAAALADLQFPAPLTTLAGVIVRDGEAVGSPLSGSVGTTFAATPGTYSLYANAEQGATPGSFGINVAPPVGAAVLQKIQNVVPAAPASDVGAFDTFFDVTMAGDYTLTLTDFGTTGFFDAFTSTNLGVTRDDQLVQSLTAPGSFTFAAVPGRYGLAIVADPAGTSGEGLLGVRIRGGPDDTLVYDRTEAVGADFIAASVDVAGAQSVDVQLTDLAFPAGFASIRVAVTRGAERVGEIVGAGTFSFQATPGAYILNLLATPDAVVGYGTFGLRASVTPPAPTVSLTASAASVTVGGSVTLTWSAQNADTCTASNGWSGSRGTTGSVSTGALQAPATFTLTCTGPGGRADASAAVTVTAAQRSGGGGSSDVWFLLVLAGAAVAGRRRTRLFRSSAPT